MSRRRRAVKRINAPDPVYHDKHVATFINKLMYDGKKSKAEAIFYRALDMAAKKTKKEPLEVFNQALQNVMPVLEVKSRRVTFLKAELGFLGVIVQTLVHTPLFKGLPCKDGVSDFLKTFFLPFLTNWFMVGISYLPLSKFINIL